MPVYQTKERTVRAEQLTDDVARAYLDWHIANAETPDGLKDERTKPALPDGLTYSEHHGFSIDVPSVGSQRVGIGNYIVREGRSVRVESQKEFEDIFCVAPPPPVVEPVPSPRRAQPRIPLPASVKLPNNQDDKDNQ